MFYNPEMMPNSLLITVSAVYNTKTACTSVLTEIVGKCTTAIMRKNKSMICSRFWLPAGKAL